MREKHIEQKLVKAVKSARGLALKFTSFGFDGVPDRMLLFPRAKAVFVEVKVMGQKPRPLQVRRKRQLEALGFSVYIIDNEAQIGGILDEIRATRISDVCHKIHP